MATIAGGSMLAAIDSGTVMMDSANIGSIATAVAVTASTIDVAKLRACAWPASSSGSDIASIAELVSPQLSPHSIVY
jgi:hypothetical protein